LVNKMDDDQGVHDEWLNEGDVVISDISFKYFTDLIEFIEKNGLKDKFKEWRSQR
jgi:hypothetical protein